MSVKSPLVIANWKLNGSTDLLETFRVKFTDHALKVQIGVCAPYVYLSSAVGALKECSVEVGAQAFSLYESGAYTGETSAEMVKSVGAFFSLVGHSERRTLFGETDKDCNAKLAIVQKNEMYAVLCVGESQQEREANQTEQVIEKQLKEGLKDLNFSERTVCIAYEPIWAIGTGLSATAKMAQDVHQFIRTVLASLANEETAKKMHILYGGSVKKDTASELMAQADVDGLLVGGASLDADHFFEICQRSQN